MCDYPEYMFLAFGIAFVSASYISWVMYIYVPVIEKQDVGLYEELVNGKYDIRPREAPGMIVGQQHLRSSFYRLVIEQGRFPGITNGTRIKV